ncbi:MAG: phosphatase PAP2 family protein [Chloroflexi bacterium]|nr:phosphatase PAP2 family protein [Chloroflexota bacterium]
MDETLVVLLHNWAASQSLLTTAVELVAEYGVFVLPISLVILWVRAEGMTATRQAILTGCGAALIAFGLGLILELTLGRPRPFVELGFAPLIQHVADSSFPSDHTLTGVALIGPLLWTLPRAGWLLLAWALIVGAARVAAGLHHPSDILGSAALALALDVLVWILILPRGMQLWSDRQSRA